LREEISRRDFRGGRPRVGAGLVLASCWPRVGLVLASFIRRRRRQIFERMNIGPTTEHSRESERTCPRLGRIDLTGARSVSIIVSGLCGGFLSKLARQKEQIVLGFGTLFGIHPFQARRGAREGTRRSCPSGRSIPSWRPRVCLRDPELAEACESPRSTRSQPSQPVSQSASQPVSQSASQSVTALPGVSRPCHVAPRDAHPPLDAHPPHPSPPGPPDLLAPTGATNHRGHAVQLTTIPLSKISPSLPRPHRPGSQYSLLIGTYHASLFPLTARQSPPALRALECVT